MANTSVNLFEDVSRDSDFLTKVYLKHMEESFVKPYLAWRTQVMLAEAELDTGILNKMKSGLYAQKPKGKPTPRAVTQVLPPSKMADFAEALPPAEDSKPVPGFKEKAARALAGIKDAASRKGLADLVSLGLTNPAVQQTIIAGITGAAAVGMANLGVPPAVTGGMLGGLIGIVKAKVKGGDWKAAAKEGIKQGLAGAATGAAVDWAGPTMAGAASLATTSTIDSAIKLMGNVAGAAEKKAPPAEKKEPTFEAELTGEALRSQRIDEATAEEFYDEARARGYSDSQIKAIFDKFKIQPPANMPTGTKAAVPQKKPAPAAEIASGDPALDEELADLMATQGKDAVIALLKKAKAALVATQTASDPYEVYKGELRKTAGQAGDKPLPAQIATKFRAELRGDLEKIKAGDKDTGAYAAQKILKYAKAGYDVSKDANQWLMMAKVGERVLAKEAHEEINQLLESHGVTWADLGLRVRSAGDVVFISEMRR